MEHPAATEKVSVSPAAKCLTCKDCADFQHHSWRKSCAGCGCSRADHAPGTEAEDDRRMGRLLGGTAWEHLTARLKGGGGLRTYRRNRMVVTNPVVSRRDPTFSTITYDWVPHGRSQSLAVQYMDLLPEGRRPISGTQGSLYRRRQLLRQLPLYDQDPMSCQGLSSEEEISTMMLFVSSYKDHVLGVGEVALPGEGGALEEAANQRRAREATEAKDEKETPSKPRPQWEEPASADNSAAGSTDVKTQHWCSGCGLEVPRDQPVVFAGRAGFQHFLWHPSCFLCCRCQQGLVDLVYFWTGPGAEHDPEPGTSIDHVLFCGRHYCETRWPRCAGCDELIFSHSFFTAPDDTKWHHHHYCGTEY